MMNKNDWRLTNQINYLFQRQASLFPENWCRFQKQWQKRGMILTAGLCFMSTM